MGAPFKIDLERKFRWRVRFDWPNEEGEAEEREMIAVFRRLPSSKWAERLADIAAHQNNPRMVADLVGAVIEDVFLDFAEVEFDGGDRNAARAQLADDLSGPLFRAYCDAMAGGVRAKNSEAPPSESAD